MHSQQNLRSHQLKLPSAQILATLFQASFIAILMLCKQVSATELQDRVRQLNTMHPTSVVIVLNPDGTIYQAPPPEHITKIMIDKSRTSQDITTKTYLVLDNGPGIGTKDSVREFNSTCLIATPATVKTLDPTQDKGRPFKVSVTQAFLRDIEKERLFTPTITLTCSSVSDIPNFKLIKKFPSSGFQEQAKQFGTTFAAYTTAANGAIIVIWGK